jgi:hypothetical protein
MVWVAAVTASILFSIPHFIRGVRARRGLHDLLGVSENVEGYIALCDPESDEDDKQRIERMRPIPRRDWRRDWLRMAVNSLGSVSLWTVPWIELNLGQSTSVIYSQVSKFNSFIVLVVGGYLVTVILCMVLHAPLTENPNRAGMDHNYPHQP